MLSGGQFQILRNGGDIHLSKRKWNEDFAELSQAIFYELVWHGIIHRFWATLKY